MKFMLNSSKRLHYPFLYLILFSIFGINSLCQTPTGKPVSPIQPTSSPTPSPVVAKPTLERQFLKNILHDQKVIWTSPFHLSKQNARWLIPLGITVSGLIATDRYTTSWVDRYGSLPGISHSTSIGGASYTVGGSALGFYLVGRISKNQRARETGLLAAEALIDSGIVTHTLKFTTQRSRPDKASGHGRFFSGGNSFPSGHATSIWTLATIVAHEYQKNPVIKYGAYGLATLVTLSRYSGRNHYFSDLLIGSAIGYGIGRYVYSAHHDKTLDIGTNVTMNNHIPGYFPQIIPKFDRRNRNYGIALVWHL